VSNHCDEMRSADGAVRAHFALLDEWLKATPPERVLEKRRVTLQRRIEENDPYFREISRIWSAGLRKAFAEVPEISRG